MVPEYPLLVMDPDDGCRTSLAELLRDYGFPVVEANTRAEGFRLARECDPALVILDPWPFGPAAAKLVSRIQSQCPDAGVLVLTSGLVSHPDRAQRRDSAMVLAKPCPPADLLAEVNRMLAQRPHSKRAADA